MTRVVHINDGYDVYIGRAGHGKDGFFGNPHNSGICSLCKERHTRTDAIAKFREYFETAIQDPDFLSKVLALKDKRLGCFCAPQRCHGDVLVEFLEGTTIRRDEDI